MKGGLEEEREAKKKNCIFQLRRKRKQTDSIEANEEEEEGRKVKRKMHQDVFVCLFPPLAANGAGLSQEPK